MKRELSAPPTREVIWEVQTLKPRRRTHVHSRTWFDARMKGARLFGCTLADVIARQRTGV